MTHASTQNTVLVFSPIKQSFLKEEMPRKRAQLNRKSRCRFCTPQGCPRPTFVDYKDINLLAKMMTGQGRMFSRKRSGNCAAFQRAVQKAVKRARFMALLPYIGG